MSFHYAMMPNIFESWWSDADAMPLMRYDIYYYFLLMHAEIRLLLSFLRLFRWGCIFWLMSLSMIFHWLFSLFLSFHFSARPFSQRSRGCWCAISISRAAGPVVYFLSLMMQRHFLSSKYWWLMMWFSRRADAVNISFQKHFFDGRLWLIDEGFFATGFFFRWWFLRFLDDADVNIFFFSSPIITDFRLLMKPWWRCRCREI